MAQRDFINNSLHNQVIEETVQHLNSTDYDIYTNPGEAKNAGVNNNFPDIIMTEKGTNTVKFIIEVETEDTINIEEATSQWGKYSREISATFYLLIPQKSKNYAQALCNQVGISVRFATFSVNNSRLTINFE